MWPKFLKSKLAIYTGIVLLVMTLYSLGREFNKRYQIRQAINALQAEINNYQTQNAETLKLITYLKTPEYQERQARPLLNLQKPGEFAVALPPQPDDTLAPTSTPVNQPLESNIRKWWNYFFNSENAAHL